MVRFEEYATKYQDTRMQRRDGILEVTFHTKGGPLQWNESAHREFAYAFTDSSWKGWAQWICPM